MVVLRTLLKNVAGPGRPRLLAYLELQAEAARKPWLSAVLDPIAASDFAGFEPAQRAAGLDDPDRFVRGLLEVVYPENPENPHGESSAASDR